MAQVARSQPRKRSGETVALSEKKMSAYSLDNEVFVTYVISGSLATLKLMGQAWVTVYKMLRQHGGYVNPEDLRRGLINKNPDESQLQPNEEVERSRRMQRNDLENIPGFLAAGFFFVAVNPPLRAAQGLMYGFLGARALHAVAYGTAQSHETRATFFTIGSLIVLTMAVWSFVEAVRSAK